MKHYQIAAGIAASVMLVCVGAAQQNQSNRLKKGDETFVTKAAQGSLAEVELGRLAAEQGTNQKVKDFGNQMVDDHSKANGELKAIAAKKGITMPSSMDAKSMNTKTRLSNLSGAAFDKAYIDDMVADHKADIAEFQKQANSGTDPDLKDFASKTLPPLQHHQQMAESVQAELKSGSSK